MKTFDHFFQEPDDASVFDMFFQQINQNGVVDIGKKFPNVAFKYPGRSGIIFGNLTNVRAKFVDSTMSAFVATAGVRVSNKFLIKVRIQNSVEGAMK